MPFAGTRLHHEQNHIMMRIGADNRDTATLRVMRLVYVRPMQANLVDVDFEDRLDIFVLCVCVCGMFFVPPS
jgi:hypothetical protein